MKKRLVAQSLDVQFQRALGDSPSSGHQNYQKGLPCGHLGDRNLGAVSARVKAGRPNGGGRQRGRKAVVKWRGCVPAGPEHAGWGGLDEGRLLLRLRADHSRCSLRRLQACSHCSDLASDELREHVLIVIAAQSRPDPVVLPSFPDPR